MTLTKKTWFEVMCMTLITILGCAHESNSIAEYHDTNQDSDTASDTGIPPLIPHDLGVCEPIIVSIEDILKTLSSLDFEAFIVNAENELLKRSPQTASLRQVAEFLGFVGSELDDVSFAYQAQTIEMAAGMLSLLQKYDPALLDYDTRIKWESFAWYLEMLSNRAAFLYHPPHPHFAYYPSQQLTRLLQRYHRIKDIEDAENYIIRLHQMDDQFACVRQNLVDMANKGLLPAKPTLAVFKKFDDENLATPGRGKYIAFYTHFAHALTKIDDLSIGEEEALLIDALDAIETSVIPAHFYLKEWVDALENEAFETPLLWQYPDGDAYYDYLLSYNSGIRIDAKSALDHAQKEVIRIREEMDTRFETLGYPEDETLAALFDRVAEDAGIVPKDQVFETFRFLTEDAGNNIDSAFDIKPINDVIIVGGGGWYYRSSSDGYRPGEFHVDDESDGPLYLFKSVTYHETTPGHHFQIAVVRENARHAYRYTPKTGFVEGWGLYAERLASEMGWYDGDIYGDLGRLQLEMLRAVRVAADIGLQTHLWTKEEAVTYVGDTVGYNENDDFLPTAEEEVDRYIGSPGTVPGYALGMKRFLELRNHAVDSLGPDFDLRKFHRAILFAGEAPFNVVEWVVEHFIDKDGQISAPIRLSPKAQQENFVRNPIQTDIF